MSADRRDNRQVSKQWHAPLAIRAVGVLGATGVLALVVACTPGPPDQPNLNPRPVARTIGPHVVEPNLEPQIDAFFANDFTDAYRNRRAILVTVDGSPVARRYNHSDPGAAYDVGAIDSAIYATLVGIALHEGRLRSIDETIGVLLPAYRGTMSPGMSRVTLRQLLTMTAGLPADVQYDESGPGPTVATILASGPIIAPGQVFSYSTRSTTLVGAILAAAVQEPATQYAQERLFGPLGVRLVVSAGSIRVRAEDLGRLGQLWLGGGRFGGRQVVPAQWVREMASPQVATGGGQTTSYGYGVWLTSADRHNAYAASGLGGQLVEVVPDLDLVVVVQSATDTDVLGAIQAGYAGAAEYLTLVDVVVAQAVH